MDGPNPSGRRWRIGELAEATGLTVRTLHHYEHVGLLAPAERTEGQQRLYDERDVRRLYRIRALRDLGLSLAEIGQTLDDDAQGLGEVLRAHVVRVDAELERLRQLRGLLERACGQAERLVDADDLLAAIDAMSKVVRRAGEQPRDERAHREAEAAWRALADGLRACLDAGEPAASPRTQEVARATYTRIRAFAGDDPETLAALAQLRRLDPPEELAGWDARLMRYLDEALAVLRATEVPR